MERATALERSYGGKCDRTVNVYVENPRQSLTGSSTAWNNDTVPQSRPWSTAAFSVSSSGSVGLPVPPLQATKELGDSTQPAVRLAKYSPDATDSSENRRIPGSTLPLPHTTPPGETGTPSSGFENHRRFFSDDVDRSFTTVQGPLCPSPLLPPTCRQCGRRKRKHGTADAAYDRDRVVDAVTCLCCVKAVFYHCCGDEDDDTHCSDSPCACTGRPRCCPRWTCLVLAGATCLPCLVLYWPARILVRLFARRNVTQGRCDYCDENTKSWCSGQTTTEKF